MFRGRERYETFESQEMKELEKQKEEEVKAFVEEMERSSSEEEEQEGENMEMENFEDDENLAEEILSQEIFNFPTKLEPKLLFHMQEKLCKHNMEDFYQESFPEIDPAWLRTIEGDETTGYSILRSIAAHDILPIPVETSPVFLYIRAKTDNSWRKVVESAITSLIKLKQIAFGIMNGCIPYHPSVKNETPEILKAQLGSQLKLYSEMHDQRLVSLFKNEENASMEQRLTRFLAYSVEYTFFYLHTYERFIFQSVIEPHNTDKCDVELENILTSYNTPESSDVNTIFNMQRFFQLKTLLYQARDVQPKFGFNMDQLPCRIQILARNQVQFNVPKEAVFKGCIDTLTIFEYFRFLDVENFVQIEENFNIQNWKIKN